MRRLHRAHLRLSSTRRHRVRALAHLALGETKTARSFTSDVSQLEPPPVRTVVSQTTPWLMFAALAHYQGNDEAARHFLLNAGQGRQPGTNAIRPSSCAETDDLEHLGDRGLLLTFLRQSVEQPRVLDGD